MEKLEELNAFARLPNGSPLEGMMVFYHSPPKLEILASFKVAAKFISIQMSQKNWIIANEDKLESYCKLMQRMNSWIDNLKNRSTIVQHLPIPGKLQKQIFDFIVTTIDHIFDWIYYHNHLIGIHTGPLITRVANEFLLDFVWNWNGTVNFVQTAGKLIYGGKLNDEDRFRMMCAYCLESELKNMYESNDSIRNLLQDENFISHEHVFYWSCVIKEEIPHVSDEDYRPYEKYMLDSKRRAFNLTCLDYYFEKFGLQYPRAMFHYCLNKMMRLHSFHLKFLIMSMPLDEQEKLFRLRCLRIMKRFITDLCPHFALQFWNHIKNSISGDQFVQLMRAVMLKIDETFDEVDEDSSDESSLDSDDTSADSEDDTVDSDDDSEDENIIVYEDWWEELAADVWKNTPQHLKQFAFQDQNGRFIFEWNSWFDEYYSQDDRENWRDDTLLLEILSDADSKFRRRFWLQEWPRLVVGIRPEFLNRFLFTCLIDFQEIRDFGPKILTSDGMIRYLMRFFEKFNLRMIDILNQFFDVLMADWNLRRETKTRLMNKLVKIPKEFDRSKLADDHKLIDGLVEFLRGVDQETKMNLICRLIDTLITEIDDRLYLHRSKLAKLTKLSKVFDNIMMFARRLCDQAHLQIITEKTPSRKNFIAMVKLAKKKIISSDEEEW